MEPSDDDDQATVPKDYEVNLSTDINQNIYNGTQKKKDRKRRHTEQSRVNINL